MRSRAPRALHACAALAARIAAVAVVVSATAALRSEEAVLVELECAPPAAEIGEPVLWTLAVEHPLGAAVRLSDEDPFDGGPWVLLAERRRTIEPGPGAGRATTTWIWTVFALEPGEHGPSELRVDVELADRLVSRAAGGPALAVRPALAEGEDAPRPLAGFRPLEGAGERGLPAGLIALGALAALAAAAWLVLRARRRRARAAPLPAGPLEVLAALEARVADSAVAAEIGYGVSHLVRGAADALIGEERAALTDREWAEGIRRDARIPESVRGEAASLLEDLEPLKYAHARPTRFALEETLRRARAALNELEGLRAQAAAGTVARVERKGAA